MRMGLVTASLLMTAVLLLTPAATGVAGESGTSRQGVRGAVHGRTTSHGEFRGSGVAPHRSFAHDHFRGHGGIRTRVFIGSGFWWGAPWWWGPAYPYYTAPPAVTQEEPPVYIQQTPEPSPSAYWYYCQDPQGYYPYVKECPGGWLTVVPPSNPPPPPH